MTLGTRISVITVVKNGAECLEETILSVLKLKASIWLDYLIIDGGSDDGSVDIIRRYADRLFYWVSEQDSGIYDAMNKGWSAAANDSFILFLGAGDLLVSLPVNLESYSCNDAIYGSVAMGDRVVFRPRSDYHLKLYNTFHHQALLVNKKCHQEVPFDTRYPVYADFDFNQRLLKDGVSFRYSKQLIAYARPGGLSDRGMFFETLCIINKNFGLLWVLAAATGYAAMRVFPFLKRFKPFKATNG